MMRSVVVLPAPLGPSRPNTSPGATWKETSSTARTSVPPATEKQRVTFSTRIIAEPFHRGRSTPLSRDDGRLNAILLVPWWSHNLLADRRA